MSDRLKPQFVQPALEQIAVWIIGRTTNPQCADLQKRRISALRKVVVDLPHQRAIKVRPEYGAVVGVGKVMPSLVG